MTDPVASKSAFLSMYMSSHPDTLAAYVMHYTKTRNVATASMQSIDSKAMYLSYSLKGSDVKTTVRVPFDPPLLGYEEVKPRLMSMKVDAEVDLGMAKNPVINTFSIPWRGVLTSTLPMQSLLVWCTVSHLHAAETLRNLVGGWTIIKTIWVFVVAVHASEALYTLYLCRKHKTGLLNSLLWALGAFSLGYPFLLRYRSLVKQARIDSIMKE